LLTQCQPNSCRRSFDTINNINIIVIIIIINVTSIMPSTGTIVAALLAVSIGIYALYQWALPKPLPGIPYDERASRSLFGNMLDVIAYRKQHGRFYPMMIQQNVKHNSPVTQIWGGPLSRPLIVLTDHRETYDITHRRAKEFDHSIIFQNIMSYTVPYHHISMLSADPRFKGNRELVRDLMSPAFQRNVAAPSIHARTAAMVELWRVKAHLANGKPFDAATDCETLGMDMITATAFGFGPDKSGLDRSLRVLASKAEKPSEGPHSSVVFPRAATMPDIAAFDTVLNHGNVIGATPMGLRPSVHWLRLLTSGSLRAAFARKKSAIRAEIDKSLGRLASGDQGQRSAVDHIVQRERAVAAKESRSPDFHSPRIIDELFGLITGGYDTTTVAVKSLVKVLAQCPEQQEKLRQALLAGGAFAAAKAEHRQPTAAEIMDATTAGKSVPYLDAFIEETLRVRSPTPGLGRTALVDTVVLGHRIPKGTSIVAPIQAPHVVSPVMPIDESLRGRGGDDDKTSSPAGLEQWDPADVAEFKPERWLRPTTGEFDAQAGPVILAFSGGPRGCFGRKQAYNQLRITLTLLVWNFRFLPVDDRLDKDDYYDAITCRPLQCYARLEELDV
jgi:cytochrome P450